jgi:hypothetical protein
MRSYFDEAEGDTCARCDNCTRPTLALTSPKLASSALSDAALERLVASAVGSGVDAAAVSGLRQERATRKRPPRARVAAATG